VIVEKRAEVQGNSIIKGIRCFKKYQDFFCGEIENKSSKDIIT